MNISSIKTPGVYINEIDAFPPSVAQVATAIPAFVGFTEDATLLNVPTRISSLLEFEENFGGAPIPTAIVVELDANNIPTDNCSVTESVYELYHSMLLYFANGGGDCYIVSVGDYTVDPTNTSAKTLLIDGIATLEKFDEPTLILFPDAINLSSLADLGFVQKAALAQCKTLMDRFVIMDAKTTSDFTDFRTNVGNENLKYGAAYYPLLETNLPHRYRFDQINGVITKEGVAVDFDTIYPALAAEIAALLLLTGDDYLEAEALLIPKIPIYPAIISKLSESTNTVPPSGAIAGIYAQTDATRGVWKAPANVSVNGIIGLTEDINDADQGTMNIHSTGKSINAIRKFTGSGFLVWGGRTLDGNSNDWRYVNVRRLANMIEESVKKACMRYVFEPNVAQTWVNVKGMIENYLTTVWNDGGLAGAKPEHAFFVAVGIPQTMTKLDILEGRMIVKIGYAPSRPAEFIVLEFKQMQQIS
jgi:uncharacterized protein